VADSSVPRRVDVPSGLNRREQNLRDLLHYAHRRCFSRPRADGGVAAEGLDAGFSRFVRRHVIVSGCQQKVNVGAWRGNQQYRATKAARLAVGNKVNVAGTSGQFSSRVCADQPEVHIERASVVVESAAATQLTWRRWLR